MSIWLKEYFARTMVFTVMATSVTAISAASIELIRSVENESASTQDIAAFRENQPLNHELENTQSPDTTSYGAKALQSIFVLSKVGLKIAKSALKFVRRNPGKALTMALAMQNKTSSFRIPSTEALSVTNSFQNITSDNTTVTLMPMAISGNKAGVFPESTNVTIVLADKNSGNLSSCYTGWTFSNGIWNTYQDNLDANALLGCFLVTRAVGYLDTIYISSLFIDLAQSTNTAQGMIVLDMPGTSATTQPASTTDTTTSRHSDIPSTSQMTHSSSTMSTAITISESSNTSLTNQSSSAITTENNNSSSASVSGMTQFSSTTNSAVTTLPPTLSQNSTSLINTSNVATLPTPSSADGVTTSGSDASSAPFAVPTSKPSYAIIIGSAVGGSLALCSIIAGVVAWVRGWCGLHKASSSEDRHDQELDSQHSSNTERSADYGLIIVAQPQSPKKSEYEESPAASNRSQYDLFPQPSSNSGYVGLPIAE